MKTFYSENLQHALPHHEGDFIYIPSGVPHQSLNLSTTEDAVAIVSCNDANEQETVRPYPVSQ